MEIITRKEAIASGLKKYFTGKPCKNGHISERYTYHCGCFACLAERTVKYRNEDREKTRATVRRQYQRDKEKILKHHKERYRNNPQKFRKYSSMWRYKNKEKHLLKLKEWRNANADAVRAYANTRRSLKLNAEGTHTAQDIKDLYSAQKGRCAYCNAKVGKKYHVDHIVPLAKGGGNGKDNLQICCPTCNLRKHAKHPVDFAQELGLLI